VASELGVGGPVVEAAQPAVAVHAVQEVGVATPPHAVVDEERGLEDHLRPVAHRHLSGPQLPGQPGRAGLLGIDHLQPRLFEPLAPRLLVGDAALLDDLQLLVRAVWLGQAALGGLPLQLREVAALEKGHQVAGADHQLPVLVSVHATPLRLRSAPG